MSGGGGLRPDFYLLEGLLTPEEREVRDRVRRFCEQHVKPVINDFWERGEFPYILVRPLAELGLGGGSLRGHGCAGLSELANGLVAMELARGDGSINTFNGVHSGLAMHSIAMLGSEEQKERWLPRMARIELIGAFALTEPEHGSDAVALETRARRSGEGWVLDGRKRWIGNASFADLTVVWARDESDEVGAFVVERGTPGFQASVITGKVAKRASIQCDVRLTEVLVPAANRLPGATSFGDAARVLTACRPNVAWGALGHAAACFEIARAYVAEREVFGRPLAATQLIQYRLARMMADITSMELMCFRLAQLAESGEVTPAMASLAKFHNASHARRVAADARDMLGGEGILLQNDVARHQTDVEAVITVEGTDTVQALIVGREITGQQAFS